ncbi:hypothetical protein [Lachnoclostridium phocaeense]|uniref:hypothetical protein n=1 Tax=Lachnoclostridium phocaeense TaxID=1871021 RepID=UPI00248EC2FF|nr:hypothetical protein [Lachnoclostridium phocaeense]
MGAIEIPQKNSIGARIQIIMLKGILLLKRAWRLGKRLIKEMGFSFVITALLMVLFVLILVWARVKTEENPNIILIVLDYAPMIYTSIVVAFAGNALNSERHRNQCLKKQYSFYIRILSCCEFHMRRLLFTLGLDYIFPDFYDNNSVEKTKNRIPNIDILIEKDTSDKISKVTNEFSKELDDFSKIWLGYEFIDCDLYSANRYLSTLKNEVISLNNKVTINTESIIHIITEIHYLLTFFRKPWRYDNKIDNIIRKLRGVQQI